MMDPIGKKPPTSQAFSVSVRPPAAHPLDKFWLPQVLQESPAMMDHLMELHQLPREFTGNLAKFDPFFQFIHEQVGNRKIDGWNLTKVYNVIGSEKAEIAMIQAALSAREDVLAGELYQMVDETMSKNCVSSFLMPLIFDHFPQAVPLAVFKRLIKATKDYAEAERITGYTDDIGNGTHWILKLLKVPTHYARLMVEAQPDQDFLQWIIHEDFEREQQHYDLYAFQRNAAAERSTVRSLTAGENAGALVAIGSRAITPVVSGVYGLDKAFSEIMSAETEVAYLDKILGYRPTKKDDFFPSLVMKEFAALLKTEKRTATLRFLGRLSKVDMDLVLRAAPEFGEELGAVFGINEKGRFEATIVARNMERYQPQNWFTAWAIGDRQLTDDEIDSVRLLESILSKEAPAVAFRVVAAVLGKKSGWTAEEVQSLWGTTLFKGSRNLRHKTIRWILSLKGEEKIKFLLLMRHPGRLKTIWKTPVTEPRYSLIMKRRKALLDIPLEILKARLEFLNRFLFHVPDEKFVALLTCSNFERRFRAFILSGGFELQVSYGLQQMLEAFRSTYGELLGSLLPHVKIKLETSEKTVAAIVRLFKINLVGLDKKKIDQAYKRLARKFHPDQHKDDPQAEDLFKMIGEGKEVFMAILGELAGEGIVPDAVPHSLLR